MRTGTAAATAPSATTSLGRVPRGIASWPSGSRALITARAPDLSPKPGTGGMPAYARDGKVVSFFQTPRRFESRYATFGFSHEANLDEGAVWPTSFALKELITAKRQDGALVKRAVS
jgi:hypothetical protein